VHQTSPRIALIAQAPRLSHDHLERLGRADWVTLARAALAVGAAALVADSFGESARIPLLVSLAVVALVLDAVDGWVARHTRTTAAGAKFDGEVDAFLILGLSVYVARFAGIWVLAIGAARYAFLVAGWALPWMRAPLPPRYWRKFVAATQGVMLTVAAAGVLSPAVTAGTLVVALVLLAESFGRDVLWLRSNRHQTHPGTGADHGPGDRVDPPAGRPRVRHSIGVALTVGAVVLVWAALVAPDQPGRLTLTAFLRIPLELLVLVALAVVLPPRGRKILAVAAGLLLSLVIVLKFANYETLAYFGRPFDPLGDAGQLGNGIETLRSAVGSTTTTWIEIGGVAGAVVVLVLLMLSLLRLTRVAADNRRFSLRAVTALGAVWLLCLVSGAQVLDAPIASTSSVNLVVAEVRALAADIHDEAVFAKQISHDPIRNTPGNQLLTGLRGKDVLLVFLESYGQVSVQGSSFSPAIDALLNNGTKKLRSAGFSARSAFVNAPAIGGQSWLGYSTLQSGVWANSELRYEQLVGSSRFNLTEAFDRAGWRTINFAPENDRAWPTGTTYYHFDKLYDGPDLAYRGPSFAYASMPDEYMFAALQRLELSKTHRRPLFVQVDTVSSHLPWTKIPRQIPWSEVGNGSIFNRIPVVSEPGSIWWHPSQVKAAYARSLEYSLNVLISFIRHYGKKNLVLIVVGDEQPVPTVSGQNASHDVPVSIIAHSPSVLKRISGWDWQSGLLPSPEAPVLKSSAFRNRFLTAYGPQPVKQHVLVNR
jgi:phosphatidylglycerophosphate synthase